MEKIECYKIIAIDIYAYASYLPIALKHATEVQRILLTTH